MPPDRRLLTRRHLLVGGGLTVASSMIPPRARAQVSNSANDFRVLRATTGTAALRGPDKAKTPIWGYDGRVPGPTLRVRRGDELRIRLINDLSEPNSIHWHGLRIANAMDGVPPLTQGPVAPGASFDYRFTVPDAGTFWYHPHLNASEQLGRGLSGLLIVDEDQPVDVDRDIALMLSDWRLDPNGEIPDASFRSTPDAAHAGRIGEHMTVNGQPAVLDIPVRTNERIRLRIVNAANARLTRVRVQDHPATVMAIDGQPAEPFLARDSAAVLGPGNRVDVFIDAILGPGGSAPIILSGYGMETPIARLVYADGPPARPRPRVDIQPLPANPLPQRMEFQGALRLDVPIEGGAMGRGSPAENGSPRAGIWTLAGKAMSGHDGPPLFRAKRGRTVMLSFPNRTAFPHAMHVHGHHARLLDRLDDGWKPFWLDTVIVPANATARIAFVADNPGKWALHCHMLEHQETGMSAWFEVT